MLQSAEIDQARMLELGYVQLDERASELWENRTLMRRVWYWECSTAYFDVPDPVTGWKSIKRLRYHFTPADVERTMAELGWL